MDGKLGGRKFGAVVREKAFLKASPPPPPPQNKWRGEIERNEVLMPSESLDAAVTAALGFELCEPIISLFL